VSEDEVLILIFSVILALIGMGVNRTNGLHRLYFRDNPAPGIIRLGVLLAIAWIAYVLWRHADPSVTGIYVVFYLILGFAAVKFFGQTVFRAWGLSSRLDAGERRNIPAALVIAAFTLATGMIFGGSLWGEADPVGDDEGGWWIPVGFFLLGWIVLMVAFGLFLRRDRIRLADRLGRERNLPDARAAAIFLLSSASLLTEAVAGDFWGWRHGLLTFGTLAVLLLVHEMFGAWTARREESRDASPFDPRRAIESTAYLLIAGAAWLINRYLDRLWSGG
jgi:hypothetical protein